MKTKGLLYLAHLAAAASMAAASTTANADWYLDSMAGVSAGEPQDVVISLKVNPLTNPETACLSITLARALKGNGVTNVTLFPTLDGVTLGDAKVVDNKKFRCSTPFPEPQPVSLADNLERFLDGNMDNMVVCPICWGERYGEEQLPDYGFLPPPGNPAVGKLLLDAEKIIDF
jgi:hypothetical protein